MGIILTRQTISKSGSGSSGAFTNAEKLSLEMNMEYKAAISSYYKELSYSDNLSNVSIWFDDTKVLKLFNKDLTYSSGSLSKTLLTRISDNAKLLSLFNYDINGNLSSVTVSAG